MPATAFPCATTTSLLPIGETQGVSSGTCIWWN